MKSLVVDLRNNPGGLLNVAVDVCRLFIGGSKLIVYTEGRRQAQAGIPCRCGCALCHDADGHSHQSWIGLRKRDLRGVPAGLSSRRDSGSESFGKGSVQSVIPLADGSGLRLTTAKYYTPSGRTFHRDEKTGKGGITPDIIIDVPREVEIKLQTQEEEIYNAKPKAKTETKPEGKEKDKDKDKDKDKGPVSDEALERAQQILQSRDIFLKLKEVMTLRLARSRLARSGSR